MFEKKSFAKKIAGKTGEDVKTARLKMEKCCEKYNLDYQTYFDEKLYKSTGVALDRRIKKLRAKQKSDKRLAEKNGMSYEDLKRALKEINDKKLCTVSSDEYFMFSMNKLDSGQIDSILHQIKEKNDAAKLLRPKLNDVFKGIEKSEDVLSEMNKLQDMETSLAKQMDLSSHLNSMKHFDAPLQEDNANAVLLAGKAEMLKDLFSFSLTECGLYRMYEKDIPEIMRFFSVRDAVKLLCRANPKSGRDMLNDKYKAAQYFKDFYQRNCVKIEAEQDLQAFMDFTEGKTAFVKKPYGGRQGSGVEVIRLDDGTDRKALFDKLLGEGTCVLEELIVQNEKLASFNPESVNTVRVITVNNGEEIRFLPGILRTGQPGSFVDNGGAGGVTAPYEVETGLIISDGADKEGNVYETHPGSGIVFKGFQLPDWNDVKDLARRAAERYPQLRIVGWDFAYAEEGKWVMVEANALPRFLMCQCPDNGMRQNFLDAADWMGIKIKN